MEGNQETMMEAVIFDLGGVHIHSPTNHVVTSRNQITELLTVN